VNDSIWPQAAGFGSYLLRLHLRVKLGAELDDREGGTRLGRAHNVTGRDERHGIGLFHIDLR
jgi:hypothetical protein